MSKKVVEFIDLLNSDYSQNKISNAKLINGVCVRCKKSFEYSRVKKFLRNRTTKLDKKHLWQTCQHCWLILNTIESEEWMEKNRKSQLIAQNKPEQKTKNAIGVSRSWTEERKYKASQLLKNKWENDDKFKQAALNNISWTQTNNDKFRELMRKSIGNGGLKGTYKSIDYDSALELSYILYCFNNNIKIKRYDLPGINYLDENNQARLYIPDFIIDNYTIVEIKGLGLYYKINYNRNIKKIEALKIWTDKNNYDYRLILSDDKILIKNYNIARRLHYEIKK